MECWVDVWCGSECHVVGLWVDVTSRHRPILWVLPWLSCPISPAKAALPWQPCLGSSGSGSSVLKVLSWQSCPGSPLWQLFQSCSASPFPSSRSTCLFLLSSSDYPVLTILFCQSCFACPVLPALLLFWLSCSACRVLPVLSCLTCYACPVLLYPVCSALPVLSCLSFPACPVLLLLSCLSCPACPVLPFLVLPVFLSCYPCSGP
jgi:hypothetical protein